MSSNQLVQINPTEYDLSEIAKKLYNEPYEIFEMEIDYNEKIVMYQKDEQGFLSLQPQFRINENNICCAINEIIGPIAGIEYLVCDRYCNNIQSVYEGKHIKRNKYVYCIIGHLNDLHYYVAELLKQYPEIRLIIGQHEYFVTKYERFMCNYNNNTQYYYY